MGSLQGAEVKAKLEIVESVFMSSGRFRKRSSLGGMIEDKKKKKVANDHKMEEVLT